MEQLDGDRERVKLVDVPQGAAPHLPQRLVHHAPGVQDRGQPGRHHEDEVDEVLRVPVEHVDRPGEQSQAESEEGHDHKTHEDRGDAGQRGPPPHVQGAHEKGDHLGQEVHEGYQHGGDREELTRQVDLLHEGGVADDGARGVPEYLTEIVDENDAGEHVDDVVRHLVVHPHEHADGIVEDQELRSGLGVAPQHTEDRAPVTGPKLLVHDQRRQVGLLNNLEETGGTARRHKLLVGDRTHLTVPLWKCGVMVLSNMFRAAAIAMCMSRYW